MAGSNCHVCCEEIKGAIFLAQGCKHRVCYDCIPMTAIWSYYEKRDPPCRYLVPGSCPVCHAKKVSESPNMKSVKP